MKETTRILRFAIVGTSNALIAAVVIWLLMVERGGVCGLFDQQLCLEQILGVFRPSREVHAGDPALSPRLRMRLRYAVPVPAPLSGGHRPQRIPGSVLGPLRLWSRKLLDE